MMSTGAQDPIQKLFLEQLKKASADVYKAGAVSCNSPIPAGVVLHGGRR